MPFAEEMLGELTSRDPVDFAASRNSIHYSTAWGRADLYRHGLGSAALPAFADRNAELADPQGEMFPFMLADRLQALCVLLMEDLRSHKGLRIGYGVDTLLLVRWRHDADFGSVDALAADVCLPATAPGGD